MLECNHMENRHLIDLSVKYGLSSADVSKLVSIVYQVGVHDMESKEFKRIVTYLCENKLVNIPPEEIIEEMRLKWPEWLPDALAKQSSPIKINRHQLIVGVFGASWAQEMEFSKPSLLESLKKSYPSLGLTEIRSQRLTRPSLSI